ncbi:MAG: diaminopimelate epimerase [Gemmatimonadota bacterium]
MTGDTTLRGQPFVKMSGGGNDFVVFDNRSGWFPLASAGAIVAGLCRGGLGIGADAVLLLEEDSAADFRMRYFNADGGEAPMCGNGALCIARYARLIGAAKGSDVRFLTGSGPLRATVPDPARPEVILHLARPRHLTLDYPDLATGPYRRVGFLDTATPHVVALVDDAESHDVSGAGAALRDEARWNPPGTNVNFITVTDRHTLRMRTYERGVEDETLSCGTGATASAILAHLWGLVDPPVTVRTSGGFPLTIGFSTSGEAGHQTGGDDLPEAPTLAGDARIIFRGTLEDV